MRAWTITQMGDPQDVLKLADIQKPQPKADEALIHVKAAALNFFDILQCQGKYQEKPDLPFVPGAEVAGKRDGLFPDENRESWSRRITVDSKL